MWKIFNPALCRTEEMPKLLILRDCTATVPPPAPGATTTQTVASGSRSRTATPQHTVKIEEDSDVDEDLEEDEEARILDMLRRGTFDIGSIDYRGQ